jgi:ATP-dependent Clp protease adaptor protein ClpS
MEQTLEKPVLEIHSETEDNTDVPSRVVLYNDDWHSFDEVIFQIIKATNCNYETARGFAFEVHVKGKAVVFTGPLNRCLKVSSVLEEIELNTQVIT